MPSPRPNRALPIAAIGLGLALAVGATLATAAPALASGATPWPTQSLGDRGTDVRAIQHLLRAAGAGLAVDGVFAAATDSAVRAFQAAHGLAPDGVVAGATWRALVPRLARGSTGDAVRALQVELNGKRRAGLATTGLFDRATREALAAFQRHAGLPVDGSMDRPDWRRLAWHFEKPRWAAGRLCDYSVGNGRANWGTANLTAVIREASFTTAAAGHGGVAVGDVSHEHGGDIAGHDTHEHGLDVDLRPMRRDGGQCTSRTNIGLGSYSRARTRALVLAIRAAAPGHVKVIWFNDPQLVAEGLVTRRAGHDDHLHVRLCEASHALARYDC